MPHCSHLILQIVTFAVDHLHLVFRDLVLLLLLVPHALHQRILLLYFAFFEKLCLQIQKSHAI